MRIRDGLAKAWSIYRHIAAIRVLLETVGAWKYLVLVLGLAMTAAVVMWSKLPWELRLLIGFGILSVFVFLAGLSVALWRTWKLPPEDRSASFLDALPPLPLESSYLPSLGGLRPFAESAEAKPAELSAEECRVEWSTPSSSCSLRCFVWNGTPHSCSCTVRLDPVSK